MPVTLTAGTALLVALFAQPAPAAEGPWRQDRACGERQPSVKDVETPGCHRSWCAPTALGRVCACVHADRVDTRFSLERPAGTTTTWTAPFLPPMGGDASHFRIDRAGDDGLFVAAMSQETLGIAISTWSVWAIDRERVSKPLEVQNYGTLSFPVAAGAGGACRLLAARWHRGWEPGRGHGTYIAGSWYAVAGGELEPVEDRPAVHLRYLFAVERARYAAEERAQPLLWFRDATVTVGPRPVTGRAPGP